MTAVSLYPVLNHLWQSTLFGAAAALLALALRKNRAQTRYLLWLIASLKFLIPFSVLITIGGHLKGPASTAVAHPAISAAVQQIGQPFATSSDHFDFVLNANAPITVNPLQPILLAIWLCGFTVVLFSWLQGWLRVRAMVRAATPMHIEAPIRVLSSPSSVEPGVFGIVRPVLLLPAGISRHLTPAHLEAILAHELCHVRRRDNFFAALHMLIEAIFWFYPLIWWIGARLMEEREHACDEEVLRLGNQPDIYAESILKTCQLCLEPAVACVAGVTGADLRKRIVCIMTQPFTARLTLSKKLLLLTAGITAVGLPLAIGTQSSAEKRPEFEVAAIRLDKSGSNGSHWSDHSGKMFVTNITLSRVIERAYGIHDYQISGPSWLKSERYDIEAEAPASIPKDQLKVQVPLMLQSLLNERFKLAFHHEEKTLPVYALVIAKSGPKLTAVKNDGHTSSKSNRGHLSVEAGSMAQIADELSHNTDRPVLDKTGLTGLFKCELTWTPDDESQSPSANTTAVTADAGPSLFTAVQEQLGLKLVPQKGSVQILVIDHLERIPTEN